MEKSGLDDDGIEPHVPHDKYSKQAQVIVEGHLLCDAKYYLNTVRDVFHEERNAYKDFIGLMQDFKAERHHISSLLPRVKELFKGHRDLILGFDTFLPQHLEISLPSENELYAGGRKPVNLNDAVNFVTKVKNRFEGNGYVYQSFCQCLNLYREGKKTTELVHREVEALLRDHPDLQLEFTQFLPMSLAEESLHNAQPVKETIEDRDDEQVGHKYVDSDAGMQLYPQREKSTHGEDSVSEHSIEEQAHTYIGCNNEQPDAGMHWLELALSEKAKERIEYSDDYRELKNCLVNYRSDQSTNSHLQMLVGNILENHPDLTDEFKNYFDKPGLLWANSENISRSVKVQNSDTDREMGREARDVEGNNNRKEDRCGQRVAFDCKDGLGDKNSEKDGLDIKEYERCTPSYRLLPKDYPIPLVSHRTENDIKVLNDHLVAVTSGSEDRSFKYTLKNQYEYSLFHCEDDRFELDMLLETAKATIRRVEELIEKIDGERSPICLEDHLTAVNIRCIERLYGDNFLDVMDVLRKKASLVLPVILKRLKQKHEEWARCRSDFNVIWADIFAKNFHKSLDYRGFQFKQQDMKSWNTKALLADIKDISGIQNKEDGVVQSLSDGKENPVIPQLEFEYPDPDIHDDIYQLIKHCCGQNYRPEHSDKFMNIWMTFLEPMLGVPSRPDDSDDNVDVLQAKNSIANHVDDREKHNIPGSCADSSSKQSISSRRGDETYSPKNVSSRSDSNGVQDGGCCDTGATSAIRTLATYSEHISSSVDRPKENFGGVNMENASGFSTPERSGSTNSDVASEVTTSDILESRENSSLVSTTSSSFFFSEERSQQASVEEPKTEREEGELSPNRDFEEYSFAACRESVEEAAYNPNDTPGSRQHENRTGKEENCGGAPQIDVSDALNKGKEGVHSLSDNSASASENCSVSVSESADGEKCSHEQPDEDGNEVNDNMDESEGEAEEINDAQDNEYNALLPFSRRFLQTAKPVTEWIPLSSDKETKSQLFYGNDSFYVLFRLHYILYERLQKAKLYSSSAVNKWKIGNDTNSSDLYARFMNALYNLLGGSFDQEKFEHECCTILGAESYVLFTLGKLMFRFVKQLHNVATHKINSRLIQLHSYESSRKPGTFMDCNYNGNARVLLPDKNVFRIEYVPTAARLSIQLMQRCSGKPDATALSTHPNFAAYSTDLLEDVLKTQERPWIFLRRNMKKYAHLDEDRAFLKAMEGVLLFNGLQIRIGCKSSKVPYVVDTEDFFRRRSRKRRTPHQKASCNGQAMSSNDSS